MNNDDYLRSLGGAGIGARLRRLSETIDRHATRSYELADVKFEQRWYNLLHVLMANGPMTVGDIARTLKITHVSVSQTRKSLENAGYINAKADESDGRRRELHLTDAGRKLIGKLGPLWNAQAEAASTLNDEAGDTVAALDRLEEALAAENMLERIRREFRYGQAED